MSRTQFDETLYDLIQRAKHPISRGKPTNRKCITIGENYYWDGIPHIDDEETMRMLQDNCGVDRDIYNTCLVNIYKPGHRIGFHKDSTEGMDTTQPVLSYSYAMSGDAIVNTVNVGWIEIIEDGEPKKQKLYSGSYVEFDAYTKSHRAYTKKSKDWDYRVNLTFRAKKEVED